MSLINLYTIISIDEEPTALLRMYFIPVVHVFLY